MLTVQEYKTVVELAKESNMKQYSNINNSDALWKNTVKGTMK
jgi:hypothetical protein